MKDMHSLRALSVVDNRFPAEPIDVSLLADLPHVPPLLEYIKWESFDETKFWRIVRAPGKVYAVEAEPLREPSASRNWNKLSKWTDHTILDHFGESARDW